MGEILKILGALLDKHYSDEKLPIDQCWMHRFEICVQTEIGEPVLSISLNAMTEGGLLRVHGTSLFVPTDKGLKAFERHGTHLRHAA